MQLSRSSMVVSSKGGSTASSIRGLSSACLAGLLHLGSQSFRRASIACRPTAGLPSSSTHSGTA
eukprot:3394754-Heterocapsa_arctica.AAC.1